MDFFSHLVSGWLCWYNSGGFALDTRQVLEYANSRMEVWAYSKVN